VGERPHLSSVSLQSEIQTISVLQSLFTWVKEVNFLNLKIADLKWISEILLGLKGYFYHELPVQIVDVSAGINFHCDHAKLS